MRLHQVGTRGNTVQRCALGCLHGVAMLMWLAVSSVTLDGQATGVAGVLLRHGVRFDAGDLAAVERGESVVKLLPTTLSRDVAVVGIVRVDATRDRLTARMRDLRQWLRTSTREHVGVFSVPPTLADLASLEVSPNDVAELRKCRPGSCTTKLSAGEMQRAQDELDWNAPDLLPRVTQLARQRLLRLVEDYRTRGDAALPTYADREPMVRAADASEAMLMQSPFLQQVMPALGGHLRSYPGERLAGATDVLYWSENVVPNLRPILSLTHAVTVTTPESTLMASKQLYANHYFEGALELLDVLDRTGPGEPPGVYVLIERRFRFDNLPRGLLNIRGRAANGLRQQLETDLRRLHDAP